MCRRKSNFTKNRRERVAGVVRRREIRHSRAREKEDKGERGMPGLPEARKDAVSCENPRGSANGK